MITSILEFDKLAEYHLTNITVLDYECKERKSKKYYHGAATAAPLEQNMNYTAIVLVLIGFQMNSMETRNHYI